MKPVAGAPANLALLVFPADGPYEVYWNGRLIGKVGQMPPDPEWGLRTPPHSFGMGTERSGVLALVAITASVYVMISVIATASLQGDRFTHWTTAAMAVSLIVGAIRSTAETTSSPAEILAALNRRLYGRLQGGFATCVALRLGQNGGCTIACAGHPAPFVNDRELDLSGAFPLGVAPNVNYETVRFQLNPADRLALYTDGLLEARSTTGELYGFDRLRTLFAADPTADQATEAAVVFGQDDDITVLTLTRLGVEEASTAQYSAPILSPA